MKTRDHDARTWGMLAHLSALAPVPFGSIVGPTVVWIAQRDYPEVVREAKKALNFQISMLIYFVGLPGGLGVGATVAFWLAPSLRPLLAHHNAAVVYAVMIWLFTAAWYLARVVVVILAALRTKDGGDFRYPASMRFLK